DRHATIAAGVTSGARLAAAVRDLRSEVAATASMVRALSSLREVSPRLFDAIAATGELASSRLVAAALSEAGVPAAWVDAREVLKTDAEYTAAAPDMAATCAKVQEHVQPVLSRGEVAVLGGFIGSTSDNITT